MGRESSTLAGFAPTASLEPGATGREEQGQGARATISKLERGGRKAYPTTISKLAVGLEVEPGLLFGGVEYRNPEPTAEGDELCTEEVADEVAASEDTEDETEGEDSAG